LRYFDGAWTTTRLDGSWPTALFLQGVFEAKKEEAGQFHNFLLTLDKKYERGAHLIMIAIDEIGKE